MKLFNRIISYLLLLTLVFLIPSSYLQAETVTPEVSAYAYVIIDANSGDLLYQENEDVKIYPASTVKIMTAIIALEQCSTSKKIKIKKSVLSQIPEDVYQLNLVPGDSYSLYNLLHMLLLNSAADAADSIAVGVAGSKKAFIKKMNKKAKELGMSHTSFDNTIGLDIGNGYKKTYTTAKDMAILTRYAMENTTFRRIVKKAKYIVPKTKRSKKIKLENTNQFLQDLEYNTNLYKVIGTKTGTTDAAGKVLISTAKDTSGHEVICAFFGNQTRKKMYRDIQSLYEYVFSQSVTGSLVLSK